ncbi:hypothetical protein ABTZ99_21165 [Actinosynnema sp. NPDC002837]
MRRAVTLTLIFGLVGALGPGLTPGVAAAQAASPTPTPILGTAQFDLKVDLTSMSGRVAKVEKRLAGGRVPVKDLVAGRGRATEPCDDSEKKAAEKLRSVVTLRCWDHPDKGQKSSDSNNAWMPQGVTSTSDADPTNHYDGRQALAVTSYRKGTDHARVTFLPNFANEGYKHISLVEPKGSDWARVTCHAGGSVWYGRYLLVACTREIRVFDWEKVYKTDKKDPLATASLVMIQTGRITGKAVGQFSSLGLDRSVQPNLLVVSQWSKPNSPGACPPDECRLFRFEFPASGQLSGTGLRTHDAYRTHFFSMQGAVSRGDTVWFSSSAGKKDPGQLRTWNVKDKRPNAVTSKPWTTGAESISYWNRGNGTGVLLNVTEYKDKRVIAAVEADYYG